MRQWKSPEYLRNAAACRKLAQSGSCDDRATFLDLAQHWEAMAEIEARIMATLEAIDPNADAHAASPKTGHPLAWPLKSRRAA